MYSRQLSAIIRAATARQHADLRQAMPVVSVQIIEWMQQLAGTTQTGAYFQHPLAFPSLLLPWWVETQICDAPDEAFQLDLAGSTINGYYYIRLIDNLMDGDTTGEVGLLPALGFFHTRFQSVYQIYFSAGHPFWGFFREIWFRSAEAAMQDANLTEFDETLFKQVAAQKVCAAKIPVAAVCYFYNRPDLIPPWAAFIDRFGAWHQLLNDLFDWHKDHTHHAVTWFLSEAERRQDPAEAVVTWVARQGFAWGINQLQTWMTDLQRAAEQLGSPDVLDYLSQRQALLDEQKLAAESGLQAIAKLAGSMDS